MTVEHYGPFINSGLFKGPRAGVMAYLCNVADDYGESFPSYWTIATGSRCDRSTAMREIGWLEDHGVIKKLQGDDRPPEKRGVARRANVYRINISLIRTLDAAVEEIKALAGRRPERRNGAVLALAQWAEETIEANGKDGCKVLISALGKLMLDGGLPRLLPKRNSGGAPPSSEIDGGAGEIDGGAPHPYPSSESLNPSRRARAGDAAPDGAPPGASAGGAPAAGAAPGGEAAGSGAGDSRNAPAVDPALRPRARDVVLQWVLRGDVDRIEAMALRSGIARGGRPATRIASLQEFRIPGFDLDGPLAERFVMALPLTVRREVDGQIAWVIRWLAGDDPKEPPAAMKALKALEGSLKAYPMGHEKAAERNGRITALREAVARGLAAQGETADTDDQSAEDAA